MIPLTLQIKNFLSYGEPIQTIEFGNYSLICLSGKNGHGKSALLDAITWALWGQARKIGGTAKADQGLLRLGQTQMMVCFDFECGGQRYRVKREYMQTYGKPVALLEFGILEAESNKFIPLTEKTLRDTQAKIDQALHLTFDGFTNSAFLRQGQANEFSKKSAKERKDVLAMILGLDRYENIRKLAAEKVRQSSQHKLYLNALLSKLEQELAQSQELEAKATALESQEKELSQKGHILEKEQALYAQEKKELEVAQKNHSLVLFAHTKLHEELAKHTNQLRQTVAQWRAVHRQQLAQTDYAHLENLKQQLIGHIAEHQNRLQQHLIVQQNILHAQEAFNKVTHEFQQQKATQINKHVLALERLSTQETHQKVVINENIHRKNKTELDLVQLRTEHTAHVANIPHDNSQQIIAIEKQFEKRKEHYQRWIALANLLSTQIQATTKKNSLVIDEESPSCPLCEQNLSAARKRFLKKKFETDATTTQHQFTRLSMLIKKMKPILIEQHAQLEQLKKQQQLAALATQAAHELVKKCTELETQLIEINAQLAKQQELHTIVTQTISSEETLLKKAQTDAQQELLQMSTYQQAQTTLKNLQEQLAQQQYDKKGHEQILVQLQEVEQTLKQYKELQEQQVLQAQRAQQIQELCLILRSDKQQLKELATQLAQFEQLTDQEKKLGSWQQEIESTNQQITRLKEQILQEKSRIELQRAQLEKIKKEQAEYQTEIITCDATIDDYQAIMTATGKDGIQALLIEDAIPEIEQEANQLLAKLTENQTQLFIDSLRDLKKGGTKETLDIKISDSVGIRPYELFSGGEAFRIDFALRIAISKLLARRAGTSLQTLIIDEGFGSQDDEGLAHIMDALYKIQDDFAKIIIVSHLNSMKNQFPVHFVIEKGPQGSMVHVMEQG